MSRDKQISEMAKVIQNTYLPINQGNVTVGETRLYSRDAHRLAENLYNAGYRNSTDVAEEIFAEIEDCFDKMIDEAINELSSARLEYDLKAIKFLAYHIDVLRMARITIGTLPNKYIGKDTNVTTNKEDK